MLAYGLALLTPIVIGYEISHHYSTNNMGINSSDDLIYLETQPIAITDVGNRIDGLRTDVNDFIALIPVKKVQEVVRDYYHNDREVQRAYTYLEGKDFMELKERILSIQQVKHFLKYLNQTGLDVLGLLNTLVNLAGDPKSFNQTHQSDDFANSTIVGGLHGLIDDVLDTIPQDQMLSLFFEKLETSDEFGKFVHNIGSEEFTAILDSMEGSVELRNLVYTLHNNGIYIGRIVDSLKGYFFLGSF